MTGIVSGAGIFLSGEPHPSAETVEALRAELSNDIAEGERRYGALFTGKRHSDEHFRYENPNSPPHGSFSKNAKAKNRNTNSPEDY